MKKSLQKHKRKTVKKMNAFEAAIGGIIEKARETNNIVEGDYIGENELYFCGKCKTAKQ